MRLNFISIGLLLMIMGFIIVFIGSLFTAFRSTDKDNVKISFFGLIGPIPFGFASDKKLFFITAAIALTIIIIFFLSRGAR
ncbi:DUF131 domain-containing protein [Candidatus Woesearchaeota archaeon]|nr:DUF131 domain-containing protein [Candidatus Woesearchaeota archaeon]